MRNFLENKMNVVLTLVLTTLLGALGFFGYKLLADNKKVYVPDFSDRSEVEINNWCKNFETNPCTITNDYSDTVEKGRLIYQSIKANEELTGKISFIISSGKKIEIVLPQITADTTRETIDAWIATNDLRNVLFIEEFSDTVNKDRVIKIESGVITDNSTEIKVFISKGKNIKPNETIYVDYGKFLGLTKKQFEDKVAEIGLKAKYAEGKDDYSSSVDVNKVVWHGSGDYVEGEEIRYGLSLGKDPNAIKVEAGTWVGKTLEYFSKAVSELGSKGLKPLHKQSRDAYSDTVAKGDIVWHGSGSYEEEENISYGLSLGKKAGDDNEIVVKSGTYVGKTFDEFKTSVSKLGTTGLKPAHRDYRDDYSDTIAKGSIIWHGSGTYVNGEEISYGLSLGKKDGGGDSSSCYVNYGDYIGKTEAEMKAAIAKLTTNGLTPNHGHHNHKDEYSDVYAKGVVIWHGSGSYVDKEQFNYTLSLGPMPDDRVNVVSYANKTETEFKTYLSNNGLVAGTRSEEYSDSIEVGKIISNKTGLFNPGASIDYVVSLGVKKAFIMRPVFYEAGSTYDATVTNMKKVLADFTNVAYTGVTVPDFTVGQITKIEVEVNGVMRDDYVAGEYPTNTRIIVYICNKTGH